jgi:hypothetical protein
MPTTETAPRAIQEEREISLVPDIFNAVQELWIRASGELSEKELEWFARCGDGANLALQNMSNTVECIGCHVASDEMSDNVSSLLLFLAESLRGINAQVLLREFANNRLRFGKVSG